MTDLRIDAEDGKAYSWADLSAFYKGKYKKAEIAAYWELCKPAKAAKGKKKGAKATGAERLAQITEELKAKPKAKAKVKAKAKAKAEKTEKTKGPANPKRFVNESAKIVQDCLDGLIWSTPNLARLDAYPDVKVVVRTDWNKDKVAIISGGGAGHEPMHGGFVGKGMLTAAVSGETFASPTIDAVLAAIVQVTGAKGCLLVIKNYTGDRLNFSLAAQRAKTHYGLEVETVVTKDDVATVAERGIAGTLFVHKVAGALAEEGKSLAEVKAAAEAVIENSSSMGISLSAVRRLTAERIAMKKMEVGLGIHGEPGSRVEALASSQKCVEIMMESIMSSERVKGEAPHGYACLVNNLGSVPVQELCILVNDLMKSKWGGSIKLLVGPGSLCTSLDMNGVSLSILKLTPELAAQVKAPTACAAWPTAVAPGFPEVVKTIALKDSFEGVTASSDADVLAAFEKGCKALIDAKSLLNKLDSKVGDADCGSTMATVGKALLEAKDRMPFADPKATCSCLSDICGKSMGGSSGVLLSIMFMGISHSLEKEGNTWKGAGAKAFMAGLEAMMKAGGAKPGMRTMLDALVPAAEALVEGKDLAAAATAAADGTEKTKTMKPGAGRSENVPEKVLKGNADPGAKAAAIFFEAISK
eukprot:TRINITY_DN110182_c0_g1_i1.p1 TRINITY_DN110182_c0_g1~~TRINITY_DN110182_c0_g1_i1.p1  ORF type:complete len:642 (+),score=207.63 TRINITY_DN110182_c0_g1_i1:72-1997(+)